MSVQTWTYLFVGVTFGLYLTIAWAEPRSRHPGILCGRAGSSGRRQRNGDRGRLDERRLVYFDGGTHLDNGDTPAVST